MNLIFRNISKVIRDINQLQLFRYYGHEPYLSGSHKVKKPMDASYRHYLSLPLPENKVFATYVWIDGGGINLRSKNRVLEKQPSSISDVPEWAFDGSSTGHAKTKNSDTLLIPCSLYNNPFYIGKHVLVLCETYNEDGTPTATNHRAHCAKVLSGICEQDPQFGIEQEFTILDVDGRPLGWPKAAGVPTVKPKYSYCGVGSHVAGRHILESHARACIYAGLDYGGSNAEVMKSSWEFQIGITSGIKAADDLWISRYLLNRISEEFGAIISYHPKPMGKDHPGNGCHHNFSVLKMRSDNGLKEIERVCELLCERHDVHIKDYGLKDGMENRKRLTGKFETSSADSCKWAVSDRSVSIRIQRQVAENKKGFLEDRRPAADCDPYKVCALLGEIVSSSSDKCDKPIQSK